VQAQALHMEHATQHLSAPQRVVLLMATVQQVSESAVSSPPPLVDQQSQQTPPTSEILDTQALTQLAVQDLVASPSRKWPMTFVN